MAARAGHHFRVEKQVKGAAKTTTRIRTLDVPGPVSIVALLQRLLRDPIGQDREIVAGDRSAARASLGRAHRSGVAEVRKRVRLTSENDLSSRLIVVEVGNRYRISTR